MKLPKALFPRVRLSPEQCAAYEKLTDDAIAQALHEYDDFNYTRGRQLDCKRWKKVRKCDDITVFCECADYAGKSDSYSLSSGMYSTSSHSSGSRTASHKRGDSSILEFSDYDSMNGDLQDAAEINPNVSSISVAALSSNPSADVVSIARKDRAPLPKFLAVGRVAGKVEDMVYGILTPTETVSRMKEVYTNDEIADCRILHEIHGATPDEPLRFLGLKWIIKAHSPIIGSIVRQRDMVFLESLGMRTRADGSRFGHLMMHSVEVPECRELTEYSIVRSRCACVYIFTQSSADHVDVFMKVYMELNGSVPEAIGLRTMANSLMTVANTQNSGHKRKMAWAMTKKLRNPVRSTPMLSSDPNCSNCKRSLSTWRNSGATCYFCSSRVCSKCCEQHVLAIPNPPGSAKLITKTPVTACTRCFATVFRNMKAEDVAREEVLAGEYGKVPDDYGKPKPAVPVATWILNPSDLQGLVVSGKQPAYGMRAGQWDSASRLDKQQYDEVVEIDTGDFARARYQGAAVQPHAIPFQALPSSEYLTHPRRSYANQSPACYGVPPPVPQSNEDMYTRIAKLNQAAEHVSQYVKRTTSNASGSCDAAPTLRR